MHDQLDKTGTVNRPAEWRAVVRVLRSPSGAWLRAAQVVVDDLATTFFPTDCRLCHGPLLRAKDSAVCDACLSQILPQSMTRCVRCGEALAPDAARFAGGLAISEVNCPACRRVPPDFERAVAYGVYEGELRESIHLLKYNRVRALANPLGAMLADTIGELSATAAQGLIVIPVPLFTTKQRERGYDQSLLLAESALSHLRRLHPEWHLQLAPNAMRRVRDTRSQFGLVPRERRANLRGAFRVPNAADIAGREVLLIDDILTTGATARECARVLRRAGAAKVWVATLARAQRDDLVAKWDASSTPTTLN